MSCWIYFSILKADSETSSEWRLYCFSKSSQHLYIVLLNLFQHLHIVWLDYFSILQATC